MLRQQRLSRQAHFQVPALEHSERTGSVGKQNAMEYYFERNQIRQLQVPQLTAWSSRHEDNLSS